MTRPAGRAVRQPAGVSRRTSIRVVRLKLGDEYLQLTQYLSPRGRPAPADARSNDRWFQHVAIIVSDMDSAYARLRRFKVTAGVGRPAAPAEDDPERRRHPGVLLQGPRRPSARGAPVPAGQGRPQVARSRRIVSSSGSTTPPSWSRDTGRSLAFYRDALGPPGCGREHELRDRAGAAEQRAGRPPAHHGSSRGRGPGHRVPRVPRSRDDGRPYPRDERPNDLVHWQTTVSVPDARRGGADHPARQLSRDLPGR